ncbi:replicative DNA helicase, partial [Patescibacteria group bacterium]
MTNIKTLRVPPQNIDSEKALLGSILLKPNSLHDILDFTTEDSFYSEKHRMIFQAIKQLFSKAEPIDLLTLSSVLKEKKLLDQVGGNVYITELVNVVPTASNAEYYAKMVHDKYISRRLISASEEINEIGYNEAVDIEESVDKAEKAVFDITNSISGDKKFIDIKDTLGEAWERLDKLSNSNGEMRGIPSGFRDLDNKLSGFQKSDLIIIAARPSVGKTSLALDIARQVAVQNNKPVGVFSLEMGSQQLVDRMISAESKVDAWKLRTGNVKNDSDFDSIRQALDTLSKAPIFIDDQAANNILKMRSVARKLKRKHGLELIIVDYLQLMAPTQSKSSDSIVQQVTEISRSLKHLARELDVPVIALSQLSRAVEQRGGRPRLSDLRDSGSIEQDADVVMFIHREPNEDGNGRSNITEILIEKHRNGPT